MILARSPRLVHPVAWWVWAIGLATAASRTTNPVLLALILAAAGSVVTARRTEAPWARAFRVYLTVGLVVIALRVVFRAVLGGGDDTGHVLVTLPSLPLPHWLAGVTLGGAVTAESVLSAAYDGLRLATLLCCIGAANALANPKRALRVLPGALYELGVAVVVAVTVAPQLIESAQLVRRARRLRRGEVRGLRAVRGIAAPVLHDALSRSLLLAAAMDSRGYGRTADVPARIRRMTAGIVLGGLVALCIGVYGLLDSTVSDALGWPMLLAGISLSFAGLALGGRRVGRSRYRPDPWQAPEWIVAGSGLVAAAMLFAVGGRYAAALNPSTDPITWPALPLGPALGIAIALLPAVAAPRPPQAGDDQQEPQAGIPLRTVTA